MVHLSTEAAFRDLKTGRAQTDEIFRIVQPDAIYDRPIRERHRLIFYVGHLEAFDWNLLGIGAFGFESFAPRLDKLFSFGIDPTNGSLPIDTPEEWPSLKLVRRYGRCVREILDDQLLRWSRSPASFPDDLNKLLHVAIEHRLMHAETLAYMFHQLPLNRKVRPATQRETHSAGAVYGSRLKAIPAGFATLGHKQSSEDRFGWDNEFPENTRWVPSFQIDSHKVTNGEFLEFIIDGGYSNSSLWKSKDWEWLQASGISHPAFWIPDGKRWILRTMFDEIHLPADWPVYVSHAEAEAYARWSGKRLPSEAEWHRAAYGTDSAERDFPWGDELPDSDKGNFNSHRWDPTSVGAFPRGASFHGVYDLVGNGWEWTNSVFEPFDGFEPFSFYPGYSADFFDGGHYVMKGASPRTSARMLRRSFRNWFQPHYPYVYAGFRCVSH
jgi:iron(II)-dependent oxidoreductase